MYQQPIEIHTTYRYRKKKDLSMYQVVNQVFYVDNYFHFKTYEGFFRIIKVHKILIAISWFLCITQQIWLSSSTFGWGGLGFESGALPFWIKIRSIRGSFQDLSFFYPSKKKRDREKEKGLGMNPGLILYLFKKVRHRFSKTLVLVKSKISKYKPGLNIIEH